MRDFKPFLNFADNLNVKYDKMAKTDTLVSFKVGGEASIVVYPDNLEQFSIILDFISENSYKFFILGNGTNTYFTDSIFDGIVVCTRNLKKIAVSGDLISAECGASISDCVEIAYDNSLSGLEFSHGIPGTIGGAVFMNASAFGKSFSNVVVKSVAYDMFNRKSVVLNHEQHRFSEKYSIFNGKNMVLLQSSLQLYPLEKLSIYEQMNCNFSKREATQPLDLPNAGSAFKRPVGDFASRLIDESGLKGRRVGGAMVSYKHAGFIVNVGGATAKDINDLICIIQKTVFEKFGVMLEKEIIFVE